jgi:CBS domain containing-hemolysin-like protein
MDETANAIEARLSSNADVLDNQGYRADGWREQLRQRPDIFLSAAFIGGVIVGMVVAASREESSADGPRPFANGVNAVKNQALELWSNVQTALLGVVSTRIEEYLSELVPDFDKHYRPAEPRGTGGRFP